MTEPETTGLPGPEAVTLNALQYAVEEGCSLTLFGREYILVDDVEISNALAIRVLRELANGYGFAGDLNRANQLTEIADELEKSD
jgi:hypothetical protein